MRNSPWSGLGVTAWVLITMLLAVAGAEAAEPTESGLITGGIGAGIGAAVARPSRMLIYRRPPSPPPTHAAPQSIQATAGAQRTAATGTASTSLPPSLRDVYRTLSAEELAREAARARAAKGN